MTTINLTVVVKEDLSLDEVKKVALDLTYQIWQDRSGVEVSIPVEYYLTVEGKRVEI